MGPGAAGQWNLATAEIIVVEESVERCQVIIEARVEEEDAWIAIDEIILLADGGK